ncbi:site-specific DNA-methyltransferase [bacterium]|nr:site-specific DNA-methyltransferase [bacterium]
MTLPTPYYEDGAVRLCLGDCREILPALPAVDLVLTDPPYGKGYHEGDSGWGSPWTGQTIRNDAAPDTGAVGAVFALLRPGGACYVFSQWMVEAAWIAALQDAGASVRNRLVWAKPFHTAGDLRTTYGPQHESIIYASNGRHELRGRRDGDVWLEPRSGGCCRSGKQHPTEKPIPLLSWLIGKSSDPGAMVLDPFAGSGTTLRAAKDLGRKAIGIEIEERYAEIAAKRMAQEVLF